MKNIISKEDAKNFIEEFIVPCMPLAVDEYEFRTMFRIGIGERDIIVVIIRVNENYIAEILTDNSIPIILEREFVHRTNFNTRWKFIISTEYNYHKEEFNIRC